MTNFAYEFAKEFASAFRLVATLGLCYNTNQAAHRNDNVDAGVSYEYARQLIDELRKRGIKANIAYYPMPTNENPRALRAVVAYNSFDGELLIADPFEDAVNGVTIYHYLPEDATSCRWRKPIGTGGRFEFHDNSKTPASSIEHLQLQRPQA